MVVRIKADLRAAEQRRELDKEEVTDTLGAEGVLPRE